MVRRPFGNLKFPKYGNSRTEFAGRSFASKLEASVAGVWQLHQAAGELRDVEYQVEVRLTRAGVIYKPDMRAWHLGGLVDDKGRPVAVGPIYGEAKGFETPEWRIKKRLWSVYGPGPLAIYMGAAARPKLVEWVIPSG